MASSTPIRRNGLKAMMLGSSRSSAFVRAASAGAKRGKTLRYGDDYDTVDDSLAVVPGNDTVEEVDGSAVDMACTPKEREDDGAIGLKPGYVRADVYDLRQVLAHGMLGAPLGDVAFVHPASKQADKVNQKLYDLAAQLAYEVAGDDVQARETLYNGLMDDTDLAIDFSALAVSLGDEYDDTAKKTKPWYVRLKHWAQKKLGLRKEKKKGSKEEEEERLTATPEFLGRRAYYTIEEHNMRSLISSTLLGHAPPMAETLQYGTENVEAARIVKLVEDLKTTLTPQERANMAEQVADVSAGPLKEHEVMTHDALSQALGRLRANAASPSEFLRDRRRLAAPSIQDTAVPVAGIKSFARRLFGQASGGKPAMLGPAVAGRVSAQELALAELFTGLGASELDDMLTVTGSNPEIARNHRKAEGEVSVTVVQRTTEARSGDESDTVIVERAQVPIVKLHMDDPGNPKHQIHVDQLIFRDQGIKRTEFFGDTARGSAHLRLDLSKYVGLEKGPFGILPGTVAVRHKSRNDDGSRVWVTTDDVAAIYFVFDPLPVLHSIFVFEKKRTKKERDEGTLRQLAVDLRAALTAANRSPLDRRQANDALAVLARERTSVEGHGGGRVLAMALTQHAFASVALQRAGTRPVVPWISPDHVIVGATAGNAFLPRFRGLLQRLEAVDVDDASFLADELGTRLVNTASMGNLHDDVVMSSAMVAKLLQVVDARAKGNLEAAADRVNSLWETGKLTFHV